MHLRSRAAIVCSVFVLAFATVSAQSAVLIVSNTKDAGAGSLRASVAAAAAGDTAEFNIPTTDPGYNSSTGVYTIPLKSGEIVIDKDLEITGPPPANIAINGKQTSRIFNITTGTVHISNLSLINGTAQGADGFTDPVTTFATPGIGGAVLNHGTTTFTRCTFKGNRAFGGKGQYLISGGTKGGGWPRRRHREPERAFPGRMLVKR